MTSRATHIWDSFWQEPRLGSCDPDASDYRTEIVGAWREFFGRLSPHQQVVDLCTGNGAVPLLALDYASRHGLPLELHGVDSAAIDPPQAVPARADELSGIRFHPRTSVTDMPFADDSVDAVTSQYGIEYTPLEPAVAEIARMLRPGGIGQFITHAAEGVTARAGAAEVREIDELIGSGRLFESAKCVVLQDDATSIAGDHEAADPVAEFRAELERIADGWRERNAPHLFRATGSLLEDTVAKRDLLPADVLLAKVDEIEQRLLQHRGRLAALVDAALDAEDRSQIEAMFDAHGFSQCETSELVTEDGDYLLGYRIAIDR
ncbi:MAG: class I SAM-dependent methyltransferase [Woeseiaceae bacterium]|nr:class I SAM-dependent methyltransferase [Woeseiaceae bacterium]